MKQKFIILLSIFLFLFSISAIAIPPICNAELSNLVTKAETLFANGEFVLAADTYLEAITNTNAQTELTKIKNPDNSPYFINLHIYRLEALRRARRRRLESFGNECREILAKFKEQAAGKNWNRIIVVYEHLMRHYQVNKNKEMVIKTYEEAINYNPWHNNTCYYIDYLLQIAPTPIDDKTVSKIDTAMEKYKQAAGKLSSGMAHRKLNIKKRMGGDVFDNAIEFLKTYPNTVFGEIRAVIILARDAISFDKPEQIKQYYDTLIVLAIKQPNEKANLATIGFILNEKKKIEAIMPDIK